MPEVSITGLTRITDPKPNKGGSTVLAWFDCEANGLALHGCAFVRTPRRGLTVWPPKLDGKEGARRHVGITDEHLRKAMVDRAQETYRKLGGTDGEWIRSDETDAAEASARYAREKTPEPEGRRPLAVRRTVTAASEGTPDDGLQRFIEGAS